MSKKHIIILSLILSVTLVALIISQASYFKTAYQLKEAQFGYAVNRALSDIISDIEEQDKLILANAGKEQKFKIDSLYSFKGSVGTSDSTFGGARVTIGGLAVTAKPNEIIFGQQTLSTLRERFHGGFSMSSSMGGGFSYELFFGEEFVEIPVESRLEEMDLRNLISERLLENKIDDEFEYAVMMDNHYIYLSDNFFNKSPDETYSRKLFLRGLGDKTSLSLIFPNSTHNAWQTMGMVTPSILITVVIVLCCLYCLLEIVKQKKLSNIKNDFINNMTHELKTPIATISLASQMLKDGAVNHAPESIHRIAGIVHDESRRLTALVEQVLQSALFTETRMRLKKKSLNMNSFVEALAQKFALRVEGNGGEIYTYLEAESDGVYVDETHMTNVISNLLDNAIKYCTRKPEISIYSRNSGNNIVISVVDNGIGIAPRDLKMIFERFYRVSTGNRHDVKGFGLGLSYVKTIVEAHGGRVSVESQEGKGTRFDVSLPLVSVKES
ncbi:MAG: HAMP domain-containing histidine kinase [Odoribacter sp.]|nr:HAMP domain-containing histidine kinase [Bacteroidales bacterium]MBR2981170.1 HAMP domain-containing histidine kinase [Odoribacter sp.]